MSLGMCRKLAVCLGIAAFLGLALPASGWAQQFGTPSCASSGSCAPCLGRPCPPHYHVFVEGPPRLCWKCA